MKIKWYNAIGLLLLMTMVFAGSRVVKFFDSGNGCRLQEEDMINFYVFEGVVELKFNDEANHGARTLKISVYDNKQDFIFQGVNQGFYEFVEKGDSVFKEKEQKAIIVTRKGVKTAFQIDLGCED